MRQTPPASTRPAHAAVGASDGRRIRRKARAVKDQAMRTLLRSATIALSIMALHCDSSSRPKQQSQTLPEVTVTLLGSARDITGQHLPPADLQWLQRGGDLLKPHLLTVNCKGCPKLLLPVRSTSVFEHNGIVKAIIFRRPIEPGPYKQVLAELKQTVKDLKIDPGNHLNEQIAKWPKDVSTVQGTSLIRIRPYVILPITEGTFFEAEMVANPLGSDPRAAWFVLMHFTADLKATEAAESAATKPASQPSTGRSNVRQKMEVWKQWRKTHDKIDVNRLQNDRGYGPQRN
jgi:hypothetical protein